MQKYKKSNASFYFNDFIPKMIIIYPEINQRHLNILAQ